MALANIQKGIDSLKENIISAFDRLGIDIVAFKDAVIASILDFRDGMVEKILAVKDALITLREKLVEKLLSIITFVGDILGKVKDIVKHILELPAKFSEMLEKLFNYLFVPRDGFLDEKIESLIAQFPFVEQVLEIAESIKAFVRGIVGGRPPVVTINLGSATNKYSYGGGTIKVLDMSWYAPYKPSADLIISSLMWLCFAWRVFHRVPSIINGVSAGHSAVEKLTNSGD